MIKLRLPPLLQQQQQQQQRLLVVLQVLLLLSLCGCVGASETHHDKDHIPTRFEYKYSFKQPFYFPNNTEIVPYFEAGHDVIKTAHYIRLTPSVPFKQGAIWAESPTTTATLAEWEVELSFNVFGRGYMGGRGMAFWYAKDRMTTGDMFGSKDAWQGLGLFFDTSDQSDNRFTPIVYAILGNGKDNHAFSKESIPTAIGHCFRDYRNTPTPVWTRISYIKKQLLVEMDTRQGGYGYTECFKAEGVDLPSGYYFGMSAATSNLADDHDVLSFETYQVHPPARVTDTKRKASDFHMTEDVKKKIHKVEEKVHEAQEKADFSGGIQESVNPHIISQIHANQFKVIEALNLINQRLEVSPVKFEGGGGQVPHDVAKKSDLEELRSHLSQLTEEVTGLTRLVHESFSQIINKDSKEGTKFNSYLDSHFQEIYSKLDASHNTLSNANQVLQQVHYTSKKESAAAASAGGNGGVGSSSKIAESTHYTMYVVMFFVGISIMLCINRVRNSGGEKTKKYI